MAHGAWQQEQQRSMDALMTAGGQDKPVFVMFHLGQGHRILWTSIWLWAWKKSEKKRNVDQALIFFVFSPFLKNFHKYAPRGMLSKSRPVARRHRWWRRAYMSWRHRFWRLGLGLGADVAVTWQAPWHRRSWRRGYWRRERPQDLWRRDGALT